MRTPLKLAGLATAAVMTLAGAAAAQSNCAPRDVIVERLTAGYHEGLAGGGLRSETQVLEVWAAPETGTWTVLITRADGMTCVMASGTNWHQQEPNLVLMGTPS